MKIHKQAAIRTIKVISFIIFVSLLIVSIIIFVPFSILLPLFIIASIFGMITMIYKINLQEIEWQEKSLEYETKKNEILNVAFKNKEN